MVTSGRASCARPHQTWGLAGSSSSGGGTSLGSKFCKVDGNVSPGMMPKTGEFLKDG